MGESHSGKKTQGQPLLREIWCVMMGVLGLWGEVIDYNAESNALGSLGLYLWVVRNLERV